MAAPTIKLIAEASGVSVATVSLALRNHPRISRETAERVRETARRLGYRPNPLVTALMSHVRAASPVDGEATTALGFIHAFPERDPRKVSPSFAQNVEGAQKRARELGYRLDLFWAKEPGMTARRLSSILLARGIHGLLVGPLPRSKGHLSLDWSQFTACSIGYSMWRPHLHRAVSHHAHGMALAWRRLRRLGYRRIGLAASPNFSERVDHHWLAHFLFHQFHAPERERVPALIDETENMQGFAKWFAAHRPDAVISPHISGYEWLLKLKVAVPEEVGFVHLDLEPGQTRLSGIDQRPAAIGATALDLLTDQLNRNERSVPSDPKLVMIEPSWIDGGTTRKSVVGEEVPKASVPPKPKPAPKAKAKPVRRPR